MKAVTAPSNVAAYTWAMIRDGATDEQVAAEFARVMRQTWPDLPAHKIERASMVCARTARSTYAEAVANA